MKYTVKPEIVEGCDCEDCKAGKHIYSLYRWTEEGWTGPRLASDPMPAPRNASGFTGGELNLDPTLFGKTALRSWSRNPGKSCAAMEANPAPGAWCCSIQRHFGSRRTGWRGTGEHVETEGKPRLPLSAVS